MYKKTRITSSASSVCDGGVAATGNSVTSSSAQLEGGEAQWMAMPGDTVLQLFSLLNHRDRAIYILLENLASVCRAWRRLGSSACL
jgi:hypothetical protein